MVALPAGSAARLRAATGRIETRRVRQCYRLDVPPPRHWAGASGLAGAVACHRGVRRQRRGVPRRPSGLRPAMVGESQHHTRDERRDQRDARRWGHGVAAVAAGARGHSRASPDHCFCRTRSCRVASASAACPRPCDNKSADRSAVSPRPSTLSCLHDRGRITASPAVLIRAARKSIAAPDTIFAFNALNAPTAPRTTIGSRLSCPAPRVLRERPWLAAPATAMRQD